MAKRKATSAPRRKKAPKKSVERPVVGIIMGSRSDWETMRHAAECLTELKVPAV